MMPSPETIAPCEIDGFGEDPSIKDLLLVTARLSAEVAVAILMIGFEVVLNVLYPAPIVSAYNPGAPLPTFSTCVIVSSTTTCKASPNQFLTSEDVES